MFSFRTRRLSVVGEYNNIFQIAKKKNPTQKARSVLYHHRGQGPERWFYITGVQIPDEC